MEKRTTPRRRPTQKQLERSNRDQQIALMAAEGHHYQDIAEAFGLSAKSSVWKAIKRVMDKAPAETAIDVRGIIARKYWELARKGEELAEAYPNNPIPGLTFAQGNYDRIRQLMGTDHVPGSQSTVTFEFVQRESQRTGIPVQTLWAAYRSVAQEDGVTVPELPPGAVDGEWREG